MPVPRSIYITPSVVPDCWARLLCFPPAGASASIFFHWADEFSKRGIEILCVQYPGRANRYSEPFASTPVEIVKPILDVWPNISLNIPIAILGHSMGALIAYELCRRLDQTSFTPPAHLFVCCTEAPDQPRSHKFDTSATDLNLFKEINQHGGGIPADLFLDPEIQEIVAPILRSDIQLVQSYSCMPNPQIRIPLSVFIGKEDNTVEVKNAFKWRRFTSSDCIVRAFRGDHFFIHNNTFETITAIQSTLIGLKHGAQSLPPPP